MAHGAAAQALPLAREAVRLIAEIGHAAKAQRARELMARLEGFGPSRSRRR